MTISGHVDQRIECTHIIISNCLIHWWLYLPRNYTFPSDSGRALAHYAGRDTDPLWNILGWFARGHRKHPSEPFSSLSPNISSVYSPLLSDAEKSSITGRLLINPSNSEATIIDIFVSVNARKESMQTCTMDALERNLHRSTSLWMTLAPAGT